ncbi:hypothetical protein [Chelativorans intermedius]|uniref:Flagellar basal body-associated protein FliL n=1 Tax=Chelativorans intermedius TaxID=515947 RepID=A0ABV6D8Y4_9HYPH|nr:hypothetical protein [Chelativorans intermedius]MCT8997759.1 hypothetical protein [Chelativorans intermedius]
MFKFLLAAVWISAATLGAVLYSFQTSQAARNATPLPAFFGGLDYVRTPVISIPVVKEGRVDGYFLARLVFTAPPERLEALSLPAEALLTDELHSYLYANPQIDFTERANIDLDALRNGIRESMNARVGEELVHEVMVEQIDYLSKAEIRDNAIRRRLPPQK